MAVTFGLGLFWGPPKGVPVNRWMDDLEASLPHYEGHMRSLWMTDHFFWGDDPTYEAWSVLSFVAAKWPQFEIGPMVLGQSYRNPGLTAKMGATLQILTKGRFIMGIGAGWKEDEYHAYGYPFPPTRVRFEQLDDTLEIMKRLWTEPGKVTYRGKHYSVVDAYCEPKPDPIPPIMIGGGGRTTMLLTAKHADWWNLSDSNITRYRDRLAVLREQCAIVGRDPDTVRLTWFGRLCVGRTQAEGEARGRGIYSPANAFVGTPQQIVEQMKPFVDEGVDYFMVEIQDHANPEVIDMVIDQILPRVAG